MSAEAEQKYDVIVVEDKTQLVTSILGTDLLSETSPNHGFHTVEKRLNTAYNRVNLELYSVEQVPAGAYCVGDMYLK